MNKLDLFLARRQAGSQQVPPPPPAAPPVVASQSKMDRFMKVSRSPAAQYARTHEMSRIITMPVFGSMDPLEQEEYNRQNLLAETFQSGWRLFSTQSEAVSTFEITQGLLAPIGVGWGKTLITLMVANKAFEMGMDKILLIVPSQVLYQLTSHDIKWARSKVPFSVPIHVLGGKPMKSRRLLAKSNRRGLYIQTTSQLSTKDASEILYKVKPEIIIVDEAHNLASPRAARTKRVKEFVEDHKPLFCALSGTITSKTIQDYHHLAVWSLRENNPLPNSRAMAIEWGTILDSNPGEGDGHLSHKQTGPLAPLAAWAREHDPSRAEIYTTTIAGFRRAYQLRLSTAPGVVTSGESDIGVSLILENHPVKQQQTPEYQKLQALMSDVTERWLTPNGDEIDHAIHTYKWMYELSAGFYNQLTWPTADEFAARRSISIDQATDILERAKEHHAAGQEYASALRKWLDMHSRQGLDTPDLVGRDMHFHGATNVGHDLYDMWRNWKDRDFEGRPDRDSEAIRVCDYKIQDAVAWATRVQSEKEHRGGIVWVYNNGIGDWLFESLVHAGLDVLYCPAGTRANAAIIDHSNVNKIIVASIKAHGEGKNLQHFRNQYGIQWPRQAKMAEQLLGRVHRNGQKADELTFILNNSSEFDDMNFAACLNDSLYIHQTTGVRQRLILSAYNPIPKIFPPAVLRERGLQNRMLSRQQQAMLEEKFINR